MGILKMILQRGIVHLEMKRNRVFRSRRQHNVFSVTPNTFRVKKSALKSGYPQSIDEHIDRVDPESAHLTNFVQSLPG